MRHTKCYNAHFTSANSPKWVSRTSEGTIAAEWIFHFIEERSQPQTHTHSMRFCCPFLFVLRQGAHISCVSVNQKHFMKLPACLRLCLPEGICLWLALPAYGDTRTTQRIRKTIAFFLHSYESLWKRDQLMRAPPVNLAAVDVVVVRKALPMSKTQKQQLNLYPTKFCVRSFA